MSPLLQVAKRINVRASRYWLVLMYIAIVVTLILAFVVDDVSRRMF